MSRERRVIGRRETESEMRKQTGWEGGKQEDIYYSSWKLVHVAGLHKFQELFAKPACVCAI